VDLDDDVVRLRRAAWGGREGTEGFERGGAVPRGSEEAEARKQRWGKREGGEVGAEGSPQKRESTEDGVGTARMVWSASAPSRGRRAGEEGRKGNG